MLQTNIGCYLPDQLQMDMMMVTITDNPCCMSSSEINVQNVTEWQEVTDVSDDIDA